MGVVADFNLDIAEIYLFIYYKSQVKEQRMCFAIAMFNWDFPFLDFAVACDSTC